MPDLRARIRSGETLIGVFSDLASPLAAELCGQAGFDWAVLDLEHGAATEADLLALLYAVGTTPMAPLVRPQSAERLRVGRALDLGAAGVVLPQLQSLDEVRAALRYLRYPLVGQRGVALRTRGAGMGTIGHGDVARVVNERVVGIVQISRLGLSRTPTRSRPSRRSTSCSSARPTCRTVWASPAASTSPSTRTRCARSSLRARPTARRLGSTYDAAGLPPLLDLGFRFIGLGSEGSFVSAGARAMLAAVGRTASA